MIRHFKSYPARLNPLFLLILAFMAAGNSIAAGGIYLVDNTGNDSAFVTTGIGTEFDLKLMADANLLGFHLYIVDIAYDKTILDTVNINDDGSLFQDLGGTIIFGKYLREDSTILRIQALTFGSGQYVDGPGLLANIRLRAIGTGIVDMSIVGLEVRDVYNDIMDVSGTGATVLIDVPPTEFNLLSPANAENLNLLIIDNLTFEWEEAFTYYPANSVHYELSYGTDPTFVTNTVTMTAISATSYSIPAITLNNGTYYWKVKAYDSYTFETWSNQLDWSFAVSIIGYPGNFSLTDPSDNAEVNIISGAGIFLNWTDSESEIPNDTITYTVYFGPNDNLPDEAYYSTEIDDISEVTVDDAVLPRREPVYWQVRATNRLEYSTESDNILDFLTYIRGDATGDDDINILDIVYIINHKYKGGPEPFPYESGNADCELPLNILDIVYLINFKYKGGPPPCSD